MKVHLKKTKREDNDFVLKGAHNLEEDTEPTMMLKCVACDRSMNRQPQEHRKGVSLLFSKSERMFSGGAA